ncbi:hypothetical protein J1C56_28095 [Aminobacter anthyllidis]|uniref:Uncharacterized protein n=1 Tax=Aminobacter anthyllidis TaxID=1035067 RepID=A0A9X1D8R3_9HYPH|nr:hypothetical protein [Aminobacter anthyllidis]MBT1159436.1 hypothetical protein [Aminobacter anthyllidis]
MIEAHKIAVANHDLPVEGRLVLADDVLVAILAHLEAEYYEQKGQWNLEAGFGPLSGEERVFASVEQALDWVRSALEKDAFDRDTR